jgi:prepilin-type processing-associated H-X9-DG protein
MYFTGHMNVASTNPPPNYFKIYTACPKSPTSRNGDCYARMAGFASTHPGGLNIAMTDGSVRFLKETIDYTTYQFLGDKADGQVISAGDF